MLVKLLPALLCLLILNSCSPTKSDNLIIEIDPYTHQQDLSLFLTVEDAIVLEQNEVSAINQIGKLSMLGDLVYILDIGKEKSLSVFSKIGQFQFKVGRSGNGPGEYNGINDFYVSPADSSISILSVNPPKILHYSKRGKFLKVNELDFYASKLFQLNNGDKLYEVSPFKNDNYLFRERDNVVIEKELSIFKKRPKNIGRYFHTNLPGFQSYENSVLFLPTLSNKIYEIVNDGVKIKYELSLKNLTPSYEKAASKDDYVKRMTFFETQKHLLIKYYHLNGTRIYLLNKEESKSINSDLTNTAGASGLLSNLFNYTVYTDKEKFYAYVPYSLLKYWKSTFQNNQFNTSLFTNIEETKDAILESSNDQVVIVKYSIPNF